MTRHFKSGLLSALHYLFIFLSLFFVLTSCRHSPENLTESPGNIVFKNDLHEFGKVTEGDIIKHTFQFINKGPGVVRLIKTRTSCGCSTADVALKEYKPGEFGLLEVVIDTRGKHGISVKTVEVFMENSSQEKKELTLIVELVPPPHPSVENVLSLNKDPECKTCHLDSGVGQKGGFLYHRVCAQCHGSHGKGASASALNNQKHLNNLDDEFIRNVIVHGIPEIGMPPYVDGVSPPLTEVQIDSLIDYIRSLDK